jgi:uncharacterized protein involved in exopolysaccharide biosynthesis
MQLQYEHSFNIRDVLTVLFKHKWKIIVTFALVLCVTFVVGFYTPRLFVARAVVMVKFGREFVQVSEVGDAKPQNLNQEAIIRTEMQILTSRDLIDRVINVVGAERLYPDLKGHSVSPQILREMAFLKFRENIFVNQVKGSNLIEVYFRNGNPLVAAGVTNAMLEFFKEKHLQVFSDTKSSFLEAQLKDYEEKLKKSEKDVESFKQKNEVFSLEEQRTLLLGQRTGTEAALKAEAIRVRELERRLNFLKDRKNVFSDTTVTELTSKLNAMEQKEQELSLKFYDKSTVMINHRKEMRLVREQLRKHEEQVRNAEMTKIQAELEPQRVKVAGLQARFNEIDGQLRHIDSRSGEMRELRREAAANENNYQIYLKKSEEARISEDLDRRKMTNISIIERAAVPVTPIKSNKQKVFGIGALLSIVLSFGLAYLAEYLPQCLTTPHMAERKLGEPVLVSIAQK